MMRLKILETISTTKWVWSRTHRNHFHNKMVLAFQYGDDDGDDEIEDSSGDDDERR